MLAIWKREVQAYFYQPIAYILIGFFFLISSIYFTFGTVAAQVAELNNLLSSIIFIPYFCMSYSYYAYSDRRQKKRHRSLIGYIAGGCLPDCIRKIPCSLYRLYGNVCINFYYLAIIYILGGRPEIPMLIGGYIGFLLVGASYVAIGVFASSLTENQIVAAIISFAIYCLLT